MLARRTASYRAWLEGYAQQHGVPILAPPKGARKEEFVAPYYRAFTGEQGVVVILKSCTPGGAGPTYSDPRIHETGIPYGADAGTEVGSYEWCREPVQELDPESHEHPVLRHRIVRRARLLDFALRTPRQRLAIRR